MGSTGFVSCASFVIARIINKDKFFFSIKRIQNIAVKFLYSGRAVDNTIIHALNENNVKSNKATEKTKAAVKKNFIELQPTQRRK